MMCPYMVLADETQIVHSQIIEEDGKQKVIVHFERRQKRALILHAVSFRNTDGF